MKGLKENRVDVARIGKENRKKLAKATLTELELELRDDVSESSQLQETLSRLSGASRGRESERVNDWVNNTSVQLDNDAQTDNQDDVTTNAPNANVGIIKFRQPPPQNNLTVLSTRQCHFRPSLAMLIRHSRTR